MEEIKKDSSINIEEEMKTSYLEYSMSVIVGRALPDIRDGLKPVHRRIIYSMNTLKNVNDNRHLKSARVVGDVIGKYHPHGDVPVYEALVRMAQNFSMRYPLVDGQGNFGSVDGDNAAAMRYTECRMAAMTHSLLTDIEKETVDFMPNYDGSLKEPCVLPTQIPNLLINGSGGIAVGMSTNIPPHNISEVIKGILCLIEKPQTDSEELMSYIPGPDFPTSGVVSNLAGLRNAYRSGRGSFIIKGRASIEKTERDQALLVVTELPYQVNKSDWIHSIANLVRNKEIEGISDIRDESNRQGIRVVIEIKRGEQPQFILNNLYSKTRLQVSFGIIFLAIERGRPRLFSLKDILQSFLEHRKEIVTRRTIFELKKSERRLHILEGLVIALNHMDSVIQWIRSSKDNPQSQEILMKNLGVTKSQAEAVLDMKLSRLTSLEGQKLREEIQFLKDKIENLEKILSSDKELLQVIKEELIGIEKKFGDDRKTVISQEEEKEFRAQDFIQPEDVVVTISNKGYAKRTKAEIYRAQSRGGKGIRGASLGREDSQDFISRFFIANTHWHLLCFSNTGCVHPLKVYQIPEMSRVSRGRPMQQILQMSSKEEILSVLPLKKILLDQYVVFATKKGIVKRTQLSHFANLRSSGIIALSIDPGDSLVSVRLSRGNEDVCMATQKGQIIRFSESEVRSMGRLARGVRGIHLLQGDSVVSMEILSQEEMNSQSLLSISSKGYGKRTRLSEYRRQGRGGFGMLNLKVNNKVGDLVGVRVVGPSDHIMIISNEGQLIRIQASTVSEMGRVTQGVRMIHLGLSGKVQAFTVTDDVES